MLSVTPHSVKLARLKVQFPASRTANAAPAPQFSAKRIWPAWRTLALSAGRLLFNPRNKGRRPPHPRRENRSRSVRLSLSALLPLHLHPAHHHPRRAGDSGERALRAVFNVAGADLAGVGPFLAIGIFLRESEQRRRAGGGLGHSAGTRRVGQRGQIGPAQQKHGKARKAQHMHDDLHAEL